MIGRHCIRNPWIFRQLREHFAGEPVFQPKLSDVRQYIEDLFTATSHPDREGRFQVSHMKKFLNFVGLGVDPEGQFLHEMRRATDKAALDRVCDRHLIDDGRADLPFPDEPIQGLVARPNCETAQGCSL
jgi:tRNA-dihydrouridine synthase